jgi:hypothetical protein
MKEKYLDCMNFVFNLGLLYVVILNVTVKKAKIMIGKKCTGWTTVVRFPAGPENFSLRHRAQTGSGVHRVS